MRPAVCEQRQTEKENYSTDDKNIKNTLFKNIGNTEESVTERKYHGNATTIEGRDGNEKNKTKTQWESGQKFDGIGMGATFILCCVHVSVCRLHSSFVLRCRQPIRTGLVIFPCSPTTPRYP